MRVKNIEIGPVCAIFRKVSVGPVCTILIKSRHGSSLHECQECRHRLGFYENRKVPVCTWLKNVGMGLISTRVPKKSLVCTRDKIVDEGPVCTRLARFLTLGMITKQVTPFNGRYISLHGDAIVVFLTPNQQSDSYLKYVLNTSLKSASTYFRILCFFS